MFKIKNINEILKIVRNSSRILFKGLIIRMIVECLIDVMEVILNLIKENSF